MKICEEEKALKDRSTVTVTAEGYREMPRHPPADMKQKTPRQMLQTAGRFSMQVGDIPVNVEVILPHAKQALVSTVTSSKIIISKVIAEQKDPSKHPFQRQQPDKDKDKDDDNDNNNKTLLLLSQDIGINLMQFHSFIDKRVTHSSTRAQRAKNLNSN